MYTNTNTNNMTIIIDNQRYFTLSAAAPQMGYSLATLRGYVKVGKITTIKVGGRHYVSETTINNHLSGVHK
jgi:predicted site-specific integrase-resolvase